VLPQFKEKFDTAALAGASNVATAEISIKQLLDAFLADPKAVWARAAESDSSAASPTGFRFACTLGGLFSALHLAKRSTEQATACSTPFQVSNLTPPPCPTHAELSFS
jgi:hypothetical protein